MFWSSFHFFPMKKWIVQAILVMLVCEYVYMRECVIVILVLVLLYKNIWLLVLSFLHNTLVNDYGFASSKWTSLKTKVFHKWYGDFSKILRKNFCFGKLGSRKKIHFLTLCGQLPVSCQETKYLKILKSREKITFNKTIGKNLA